MRKMGGKEEREDGRTDGLFFNLSFLPFLHPPSSQLKKNNAKKLPENRLS